MGVYVTAAEVIAEGAPSGDTTKINRRILKWESIVENVTRNVFRVLSPGELIFDGSNSHILHFNIPLVEVTELIINEDTVALDVADYRAFTGKTKLQEDRHNPKIELIDSSTSSLFVRNPGMFIRGRDQKVTATWGYVDDDPDNPGQYITPVVIKDAIIQLVMLDLDGYFDQVAAGGSLLPATPIRREKTDGHEIEYQMVEQQRINQYGLPPTIYKQLMMFKAPLAIDIPDPRRFNVVTSNHILVSF